MTKAGKVDCLFYAGLATITTIDIFLTIYCWKDSVYLSIPFLVLWQEHCSDIRGKMRFH